MNTWDKFLEEYTNSTDEIRAFIDSEEIPNLARKMHSSSSLENIKFSVFANALTNLFFKISSPEDLQLELGLTKDQIEVFISELDSLKKKFLAEYNEKKTSLTSEPRVEKFEVPAANSELKERLELKPQVVARQAGDIEKAGTRPLTREELMNALAPKRTMASDIEAVRTKADGGGNPQT